MGHVGWPASWASGPLGGGSLFILLLLVLVFLFLFPFYLFISFSVLIQFKIFMHSVKVCFLHLKYLNINWHTPNILVLKFENFCCLTYFEFDF